MNRDERIRNQLGTVMSAAVRLGMTSNGMSREALAAEVRDLVELAVQVVDPAFGELSAKGEKHLAWQRAEGGRQAEFWRNVDAHETATSVPTSVADIVAMDGGVPGLTWPDGGVANIGGVRAQDAVTRQPDARCEWEAPADDMHDHLCEKDAGHADGPGGSDHLCEQCGQLFTLPTDTADDDVEIEL